MNTKQRANKLDCMLREMEDEADSEIAEACVQWEDARELYLKHVTSLMDTLSIPRSKEEADALVELVCSAYKAGYCVHHSVQTTA